MVDYMKLVEVLGGDLVKLVPRRAPRTGEPSPGMVLTVRLSGQTYDLDEPLCAAILKAIEPDA